MKKTAIIFDLDGTLLDTLDDLADSVNAVLAHFGYPIRTREEIRRFLGNGAENLIVRAVPEGCGNTADVYAAFRVYYREHSSIKTGPYAGVVEVLDRLRLEYPVAIVSNKPDDAVALLCRSFFPGIYARGESSECRRKPAPDMVLAAMKALGAERGIYVGDSEVDIATSRNAGLPCLSVLWGFRTRQELDEAGAQWFCTAPEELPDVIGEMEASYGQ